MAFYRFVYLCFFLFSAHSLAQTAHITVAEDSAVSVFPKNYGVPWSDVTTSIDRRPSHGSAIIDRAADRVRYTPSANYCGSDYFVIETVTFPGGGGGRDILGLGNLNSAKESNSAVSSLSQQKNLVEEVTTVKPFVLVKDENLSQTQRVRIKKLYVYMTVRCVNDAPSISNISNKSINEDSNTGNITFYSFEVHHTQLSFTSPTVKAMGF